MKDAYSVSVKLSAIELCFIGLGWCYQRTVYWIIGQVSLVWVKLGGHSVLLVSHLFECDLQTKNGKQTNKHKKKTYFMTCESYMKLEFHYPSIKFDWNAVIVVHL